MLETVIIIISTYALYKLGKRAYKVYAVEHFEDVYTLDNKCKCVKYRDRIYSKYDKSTLERASKLD